jgi:D-alanyl-D-alanine carboxypeptidase
MQQELVERARRGDHDAFATRAGAAIFRLGAEARRFSARAGHSEHQLGTALDFKAAGGGSPWTQSFARSPHALWLVANAWRFGWIQSYPPGAETQTCYGAEAWHYRYVGRDVAAEVHASGMTLRAWLRLHATAG